MGFLTRVLPDRSGAAAYVVMIRAPGDPERIPRAAHPGGRQPDVTPHRTIARMDPAEVRRTLLRHLRDLRPRTLNRIGVELWDKTGDILGGTKVEAALWDLVADGLVEFTPRAPVLFRARSTRRLPKP